MICSAYRDLTFAIDDPEAARATLGSISNLPKPWLPATCIDPSLRAEVWQWLEDAVVWLNHEYVWLPEDLIIGCWPAHPHLVHEIAVLVDQRYRAGGMPASDALEEWHRYTLPAFQERARQRLGQHCEDTHSVRWPAAPRFSQSGDEDRRRRRDDWFASDCDAVSEAKKGSVTYLRAQGRSSSPDGPRPR